MLSYNSLTYVQDMKIGHYSEFHPEPPSEGGQFVPLHLSTMERPTWKLIY